MANLDYLTDDDITAIVRLICQTHENRAARLAREAEAKASIPPQPEMPEAEVLT